MIMIFQMEGSRMAMKAEHDVHEPHDDGVDPPAVVAGNGAQDGADENGDACGDKADLQRDARPPDHPGEHIPSQLIGSEEVGG
jgi:hypothetical protein